MEVQSAVIFTTAYDQFAIQAFKVENVNYLRKPTDLEELTTAINKFRQWLSQ